MESDQIHYSSGSSAVQISPDRNAASAKVANSKTVKGKKGRL